MDPLIGATNLYLQEAPIKKVMEKLQTSPTWMEESFQEQVVNAIINHPLIVKNGRVYDYERQFVRAYFDKLMENNSYIADSFAAEYARVHSKQYQLLYNFTNSEEEGEYHFCYYPVPHTNEVLQLRLRKSSNCTAFQTWEACFAFLEWVLDNDALFQHKKVLEVGSGSGLGGQMLQCIVQNCNVIMSDYCQDVTNYILSNIEENYTTFQRLHISLPTAVTIDFCNFDKEQIKQIGADILVATDVTFSPDLVDGLVELIDFSLRHCALSKAYICCTVRTRELYDRFVNGIEGKGLKSIEHVLEQKNVWYYLKYAEIVILEVSESVVC